MVLVGLTHLAMLVQIGPSWIVPNCFGPLCLQLFLGSGDRLPGLVWRIECSNASQASNAHVGRLVVDATLERAAARPDHTAWTAAAASPSLLLGRRSIRVCARSSRSHARHTACRTGWRGMDSIWGGEVR